LRRSTNPGENNNERAVMARKIVPIERVVEEAENPTSLFIDPDDVVEVNPDDLDELLEEQEE